MVFPNAQGEDLNQDSGRLPPYVALGGLAVDPKRWAVFVSDPWDQRLVEMRDRDYAPKLTPYTGTDFKLDYRYPRHKPARMKRILCYGSSFVHDLQDQEGRFHALYKRIEYHFNLKQLARATGKEVELINDGTNLGDPHSGGDVFGWAQSRLGHSKAWSPDLCLLVQTPFEAWYSMLSWWSRPLDAQGVPSPELDLEYLQEPRPVDKFQGLSRDFFDLVRRRPDFFGPDLVMEESGKFSVGENAVDVYRYFNDPEFRSLYLKMTRARLRALKQDLAAAWPKAPLVLALCSTRNSLGRVETAQESRYHLIREPLAYDFSDLKALCAEEGVLCLDLQPAMQRAHLSFHPVFRNDNHLSLSGADLVGALIAEALAEAGLP
jgi:hypothetical protein